MAAKKVVALEHEHPETGAWETVTTDIRVGPLRKHLRNGAEVGSYRIVRVVEEYEIKVETTTVQKAVVTKVG